MSETLPPLANVAASVAKKHAGGQLLVALETINRVSADPEANLDFDKIAKQFAMRARIVADENLVLESVQ